MPSIRTSSIPPSRNTGGILSTLLFRQHGITATNRRRQQQTQPWQLSWNHHQHESENVMPNQPSPPSNYDDSYSSSEEAMMRVNRDNKTLMKQDGTAIIMANHNAVMGMTAADPIAAIRDDDDDYDVEVSRRYRADEASAAAVQEPRQQRHDVDDDDDTTVDSQTTATTASTSSSSTSSDGLVVLLTATTTASSISSGSSSSSSPFRNRNTHMEIPSLIRCADSFGSSESNEELILHRKRLPLLEIVFYNDRWDVIKKQWSFDDDDDEKEEDNQMIDNRNDDEDNDDDDYGYWEDLSSSLRLPMRHYSHDDDDNDAKLSPVLIHDDDDNGSDDMVPPPPACCHFHRTVHRPWPVHHDNDDECYPFVNEDNKSPRSCQSAGMMTTWTIQHAHPILADDD